MKVLYFHQYFSVPSGAGGSRSYQMARNLVKSGYQVLMVCGTSNTGSTGLKGEFSYGRRTGSYEGIEIIEYDLPYSNADSFLKRVATFARFSLKCVGIALFKKYDLVFATTTPLTIGIPGIFARHLRRKPFVFEVRDLWPELPKAMGVISNPLILHGMSFLEWASYRSAHCCIGLSPGIVDGIVRRGVSRSKVFLVPNGCDLEIFQSGQKSWRPKSINSENFVAIFSGSHGIANGLDAVIDVATELKRRGRNDIKLLLIGDGMMKHSLEARAVSKGLVNIIFHDPVSKESLAGLMRSVDIGMQLLANVPAFYYGTSPNKFFDYISAGLPVVSNYPGWIADMIQKHDCGYIVPPGDPELFADALCCAADNKDKTRHMSENALKLAYKFDRKVLYQDWESCLKRAFEQAL